MQNPIGDLISIPFQSNTNFNVGPRPGTQEILNIQPVVPIHLNDDQNVITRTILPLIWNPLLQPAETVPFGTGPITFSAFLSPRNAVEGQVWGVGPVVQIPTISNKGLGSNVCGGGPTAVLDTAGGKWTLPVGAQISKLIKVGGKLSVNLLLGAYYNALRPQFGAHGRSTRRSQ